MFSDCNPKEHQEYTSPSYRENNPFYEAPSPERSPLAFLHPVFRFIRKALFILIAVSPVILNILALIFCFDNLEYPVFRLELLLLNIAILLPSVLILLFSLLKVDQTAKRIVRGLSLALCILLAPLCSFLTPFQHTLSETTYHFNYRHFDTYCSANWDGVFQDLFPLDWVASNTKYYYSHRTEFSRNATNIHAQWTLDREDFDEEICRVQALFEEKLAENEDLNALTIQKGNYTCLTLYLNEAPFEKSEKGYTHYIFAYNEKTMTVRYIYCYCEMYQSVEPNYVSLDWQ